MSRIPEITADISRQRVKVEEMRLIGEETGWTKVGEHA